MLYSKQKGKQESVMKCDEEKGLKIE